MRGRRGEARLGEGAKAPKPSNRAGPVPGPDILVVAGEESSDRIAGAAVRSLRRMKKGLSIHALGGPELEAAGARLRYPLAQGGVVGVAEVLGKLSFFLKARKTAVDILENERPRLLLLVDSPDFNLPLARKAKVLEIPVLYYVCPQVWAWRAGRVRTLRECCRKVLCVFPFEPAFLKKHGVRSRYVGHPLLEEGLMVRPPKAARMSQGGSKHLGLLPGSRVSEVARILPLMAEAAKKIQQVLDLEVTVFVGTHVPLSLLRSLLATSGLKAKLHPGRDLQARASMDLSLVASGTATLETALLGQPMIVVYKVKALTGFLAKLLVRVPHVAMPNLILGRRAYPEFIQAQAKPELIAKTALDLLSSPAALKVQRNLASLLRTKLGRLSPSRGLSREALSLIGAS